MKKTLLPALCILFAFLTQAQAQPFPSGPWYYSDSNTAKTKPGVNSVIINGSGQGSLQLYDSTGLNKVTITTDSVLGSDSTTTLPLTGSSSIVHQATVTLIDAQIKALPTTLVEIIAAPGTNKILLPIAAVLHLNWVSDYANINASARLFMNLGTENTMTLSEASGAGVSGVLASGENGGAFLTPGQAVSGSSTFGRGGKLDGDWVDKPLNLRADNNASGDFTDGHVDNQLTVSVTYLILNLTTGVFE